MLGTPSALRKRHCHYTSHNHSVLYLCMEPHNRTLFLPSFCHRDEKGHIPCHVVHFASSLSKHLVSSTLYQHCSKQSNAPASWSRQSQVFCLLPSFASVKSPFFSFRSNSTYISDYICLPQIILSQTLGKASCVLVSHPFPSVSCACDVLSGAYVVRS